MSTVEVHTEAAEGELQLVSPVAVRGSARLRAYYELTKPNLSALVMITGVIGFYLASPAIDWWRFLHLVIGLWCTSGGAGALNMVLERNLDARMRRTRVRPIPSGRVSTRSALAFSAGIFLFGFAELALFTTWTTAWLALATIVLYAFVYTPAKKLGPIAVAIGAIPGAIPPVMGWAAVDGTVAAPALVLFGLLFLWQYPHFLALAWMYREDYLRAGFNFLPKHDADGRITSWTMVICAALLVPVTLSLEPLGAAGWLYSFGAAVAGGWFVSRTWQMIWKKSEARTVFFASIIYLPVLLVLIVADRLILGG